MLFAYFSVQVPTWVPVYLPYHWEKQYPYIYSTLRIIAIYIPEITTLKVEETIKLSPYRTSTWMPLPPFFPPESAYIDGKDQRPRKQDNNKWEKANLFLYLVYGFRLLSLCYLSWLLYCFIEWSLIANSCLYIIESYHLWCKGWVVIIAVLISTAS